MPAFAVPALAAAVVALIALMVLYGIAYLVKVVAHMMPDIHIPLLGNLRDIALAAANTVLTAIGSLMARVLSPIGKIIQYPIEVVQRIIAAIYAAIGATLDTVSWVVTHAIPAAIHHLSKSVFHRISQLAGNVWAGIHAAERLAHHLVAAAVGTLGHTIAALRAGVWDGIHTVEHDLSRAEKAAAAAAAAALTQAEKYARNYVASTVKTINGDIAGVDQSIAHALGTAETYTAKAVKTLAGTVASTAAGVAGSLVTDIDHGVTAALGAAWPTVEGDIGAIGGVLGAGWPDIQAWLGDLDLSKIGDIAGLASVVGVLSNVVTRYLRDCGAPNCRNLGGFGRDLQSLIGLVEDGAILALFADLAFRPAEAASDVESVLGGLARGTADTVSSLLQGA